MLCIYSADRLRQKRICNGCNSQSRQFSDSVAFDGLYERLIEKNPEIEAVVMAAGYKTPWISKRVLDDKRIPVLPYKRPMGKQDFFKPYEYVYDKYYDCVICPENHVLNYATTNREGYQ